MGACDNRATLIICDTDAGSIKCGPSNIRDYWLSIVSECWPLHPTPLFIDRRHGLVAGRLLESYCFTAAKSKLTPIILGGDHALTYYAYTGVRQALGMIPDVVQFDAHHDCWPTENITNYSFARHLRRQGVVVENRGLREDWPNNDLCYKGKHTKQETAYLTVDVDVIDPSVLTSVSFPVPRGNGPLTDIEWFSNQISEVRKERQIVAADIVEWVPTASNNSGTKIVTAILSDILRSIS